MLPEVGPELIFELSCREIALPNYMDLVSARQLIWKSNSKPSNLNFNPWYSSTGYPPLPLEYNSQVIVLNYRFRDIDNQNFDYCNQNVKMKFLPRFKLP